MNKAEKFLKEEGINPTELIEGNNEEGLFCIDLMDLLTDFAEKEKKENTIDFLIHMLKKYEGHDIIERWQMDDEYDYWTNQKFKEDES